MPVDPTDPETFEDSDPDGDGGPGEFDVEAPEADAVEQHAELIPNRDEPLTGADPDTANAADRAEQARVVELNEDEYR
ncbi:hypothetical protein [Streptomyces sp. H27-D2]|uniref:hypothetical protein n=1 Tax=Streptomyces sp. H27-D2 TaxID=3046304 RepID=UPI002DB59E20|nr:hypothetical protein [Streptomyces sp. H27-D2]MEC4019267.1 hypothetical protein [Streptomyces sp. H27-D2]